MVKMPRKAKILLIKLRSIGDVVYNTAVYAPLKERFPDAHLTVLVERPSYDLVSEHPDIDEVLCFEKGSFWGQIKFYSHLIMGKYDVAIDMHEGTRGAMMCFLTFAPIRIGNKFAKRSFLYNTKLDFSDLKPEFPVDYQVALIKKMGVLFENVTPAIHISSLAKLRAKAILSKNGIKGGDKYCVIHPGTKKIYDQWQYNKFAHLVDTIPENYGIKVVLTSGPGEESQIENVIKFVKKELKEDNQVFWVCPLIDESKKIDHQSAIKKFEYLKKIFPDTVGMLHGKVVQEEKEQILNDFLTKKYKILVSTTIIEVGIDFPNANLIIIENANKFGLSQLHQLRGRVGRGPKQASCILMFKSNLSENARKRINILKNSNDGFNISEKDMKLRGFGDLLGFKQSGVKNFRLADPIHNEDLFILGEKEIKRIENEEINLIKYKPLLKLYDQADIINDLV